MGATLSGRLADPQFRHQRAQKAARTRTTLAHYINSIVARAPELTPEQRDRLATILRPTPRTGRTPDGEAA